jgi:hypothetical protein
MEGTPRLAERGRRPFKPQTVLLRPVAARGLSDDIWRSQRLFEAGFTLARSRSLVSSIGEACFGFSRYVPNGERIKRGVS